MSEEQKIEKTLEAGDIIFEIDYRSIYVGSHPGTRQPIKARRIVDISKSGSISVSRSEETSRPVYCSSVTYFRTFAEAKVALEEIVSQKMARAERERTNALEELNFVSRLVRDDAFEQPSTRRAEN